jgi:toxin-antitoxin system PIN domain toxin
MTTYLLDVNLLLALSDPMHIHHEGAHRWFAARGQSAWATCPITENGFVRIASHPSYPNRPGDAPVVLAMLRQFCTVENHHFWADDMSIRTAFQPGALIIHNQITNVYLLALAAAKRGKLATLDQRIATVAVENGDEALELVIP